MSQEINRNRVFSLLLVVTGNILYALSVKLFLLPANLISCGTTGIALVKERQKRNNKKRKTK